MNVDVLWSNFLAQIKDELSSLAYDTWFSDTKLFKLNDGKAIIIVPMPIHKKHLAEKYSLLIKEKMNSITGTNFDLEFVLSDEISKYEDADDKKIHVPGNEMVENKGVPPNNFKSNLKSKYTFENFIVGNSNKFAHAAALSVAENPGNMYNPLFIYGNSGLGKTHLMHAIGNYITHNSTQKVLYVTSDQFIQDFVGINKRDEKGVNFNYVDFFKNKYRNVDVLIIDDIQFLGGATQTQQEFFHTFNELHEAKKQIVISSDKHPREIATLEERLRSRFEWGITADIQPPDYETKMAILKKRAELEHLDINQEVMQYVATNINSNIRELEGALNKIYVFANLEKKPVTLELAENALKDTIECQKEVTPQLIMDVVAEHYNISVSDIISKKKNKEIANPRQICMYLSRKYTDYSLQNIGKIMGNRDHTTVIHGHDKIGKMLETDENLKSNLDIIIKKLNPPT